MCPSPLQPLIGIHVAHNSITIITSHALAQAQARRCAHAYPPNVDIASHSDVIQIHTRQNGARSTRKTPLATSFRLAQMPNHCVCVRRMERMFVRTCEYMLRADCCRTLFASAKCVVVRGSRLSAHACADDKLLLCGQTHAGFVRRCVCARAEAIFFGRGLCVSRLSAHAQRACFT